MNNIPHLRIVVGACIAAVVGYAFFSVWVILMLKDATMVGDVIGTWKSFAVAAFAFWLGSSSAGKAAAVPPEPRKYEEPINEEPITEEQPR